MSSEDRIPAEDRAPLKLAVMTGQRMLGCSCLPEIKLVCDPLLAVTEGVTAKVRHHAPCPMWSPLQTEEWFALDIPASRDQSYGMSVVITDD